jgi:hypothetical protein
MRQQIAAQYQEPAGSLIGLIDGATGAAPAPHLRQRHLGHIGRRKRLAAPADRSSVIFERSDRIG